MIENKQYSPYNRWIYRKEKDSHLPSILFIAGIHGNELSGIKAIQRVITEIENKQMTLRGSMYALCGNLQAIQAGERFIDKDLNRAWSSRNLQNIAKMNLQNAEDAEVKELKQIMDELLRRQSPLAMVDLHTTSSVSPPFAIFDDSLRNRALANELPVPKVLGIIERLQGTILGYYGDKGPITLVFEAGQHDALSSIDFQESAIWISLAHMQLLDKQDIDYVFHQNRLKQASKGSPELVETTLRYALKPNDSFAMQPGFVNFSPVKKGQLLAIHNNENVFAQEDGYVFMPLYQKKGEDGFFMVRKISPFWIKLSEWLRKRNLDKYVTFFPGVKKDTNRENAYIVNTKTARFRALDFLHLLGFRKQKKINDQLFVSRIPYDLKGPWDK